MASIEGFSSVVGYSEQELHSSLLHITFALASIFDVHKSHKSVVTATERADITVSVRGT